MTANETPNDAELYEVEVQTPRTDDHHLAVAHATGILKELRRDSYVTQITSVNDAGVVQMVIQTKRKPTIGPHINSVTEVAEAD